MAQIDFGIGFKVDKTGLDQARAALEQISQLTRNEFAAMHPDLSTNEVKTQLTDIYNQANAVRDALSEAFNVKLNSINIDKFNQSLQASGTSIQQVYNSFKQAGPLGENAFRTLANQVTSTNIQLKQTHTFLNNIATTLTNTIKWNLASSAVNAMTRSVQDAFNFTKALDSSLNDIRIVTNKSAADMDNFAVKANNAAKALGTTTTEYTNAALTFYQQGLDDQAVETRARLSNMVANVTGLSGDDAAEYVTSILNGYKVTADAAEEALDKLANVGANTASSLQELAQGMSKVAASANMLGVSEDELASYLSTILSVTRADPNSVGTALKTIFARISDIETGAEDAEVSLGEYSGAMAELGFNVLDSSGHLRDLGDVMAEIGAGWGNLSREQQVYLAQTMAGTRQYSNLVALFDNWDEAQRALNFSMTANGTLQQQQNIYMERTTTHVKELTAQMEELYMHMIDTDSMNSVIDAVTTLVDGLDGWIQSLGGMSGVLKTLGSLGVMVFADQIGKSLNTMINNTMTAKSNFLEVQKVLNTIGDLKNLPGLDIYTNQLLNMTDGVYSLSKIMSPEAFGAMKDQLTQFVNEANRVGELQAAQSTMEQFFDQINKLGKADDQINFDNFEEKALEFDDRITTLTIRLQNLRQDLVNAFDFGEVSIGGNGLVQIQDIMNSLNASQQGAITKVLDNTTFKDFIGSFNVDGMVRVSDVLTAVNDKIQQLSANGQKVPQSLQVFKNKLDELAESAKTTTFDLEELANSDIQSFDNTTKEFEAFNKALDDSQDKAADFSKRLDEMVKNGTLTETQMERLKAVLDKYIASLADLKDRSSKGVTTDLIKEFEELQQKVSNSLNATSSTFLGQLKKDSEMIRQQYGSMGESIVSTLKKAEEQAKLTGQGIQEALGSIARQELIANVTRMTGAMTTLLNAFTSIKNLGNIWSNDDISDAEKLWQTLTSMLTIVTQLGMGYNTLKKSYDSIVSSRKLMNAAQAEAARIETENAVATAASAEAQNVENRETAEGVVTVGAHTGAVGAETAAETANAGATTLAAKAHEFLNNTLLKNPMFALVAILGSLIAIWAGYTEHVRRAAEAQKEANDVMIEQSKAAQEEATAVNDAIAAYRDAYDVYSKTGQNKDNLVQATQDLVDKYDIEISKLDILAGRYDVINEKIAETVKQKGQEDFALAVSANQAAQDNLAKEIEDDNSGRISFSGLDENGVVDAVVKNTTKSAERDPAYDVIARLASQSKEDGGLYADQHADDIIYASGSIANLSFDPKNTVTVYNQIIDAIAELDGILTEDQKKASIGYQGLVRARDQIASMDYFKEFESTSNQMLDAATRMAMGEAMLKSATGDFSEITTIEDFDRQAEELGNQVAAQMEQELGAEKFNVIFGPDYDWTGFVRNYMGGLSSTMKEFAEDSEIFDDVLKLIFPTEEDLEKASKMSGLTAEQFKQTLVGMFNPDDIIALQQQGFDFTWASPDEIQKAIDRMHRTAQEEAAKQAPILINAAIDSISDKGDLSGLDEDQTKMIEQTLLATQGVNGLASAWEEFQVAMAGGTLAALNYLQDLNEQILIGNADFNPEASRKALESRVNSILSTHTSDNLYKAFKFEATPEQEQEVIEATHDVVDTAQEEAENNPIQPAYRQPSGDVLITPHQENPEAVENMQRDMGQLSTTSLGSDISDFFMSILEKFFPPNADVTYEKVPEITNESVEEVEPIEAEIAFTPDVGTVENGVRTFSEDDIDVDNSVFGSDLDNEENIKITPELETVTVSEDDIDMSNNPFGTALTEAAKEGMEEAAEVLTDQTALEEGMRQSAAELQDFTEQMRAFEMTPAEAARHQTAESFGEIGRAAAEAYHNGLSEGLVNAADDLASDVPDEEAIAEAEEQGKAEGQAYDGGYQEGMSGPMPQQGPWYHPEEAHDAGVADAEAYIDGAQEELETNPSPTATPDPNAARDAGKEEGEARAEGFADAYTEGTEDIVTPQPSLGDSGISADENAPAVSSITQQEQEFTWDTGRHSRQRDSYESARDQIQADQEAAWNRGRHSAGQAHAQEVETEQELIALNDEFAQKQQERLDAYETKVAEIHDDVMSNSEDELSMSQKQVEIQRRDLEAQREAILGMAEDKAELFGFKDSIVQNDMGDYEVAEDFDDTATGAADAAVEVNGLLDQLNDLDDKINGTDWEFELDMAGVDDIVNSAENILNIGDSIAEAAGLIGEGFVVAADDADKLASIMPELFDASNIEEYTSDGIRLNEEMTNAILAGKQQELDADTATSISQIDNMIAQLEGEQAAAQAEVDLWTAVAQDKNFMNQQVAGNENELLKRLGANKDLLRQADLTAEQAYANAQVDATAQSTDEQADAYEIIGKNSNAAFEAASANAASAASVLTANAHEVVRAWNQAWVAVNSGQGQIVGGSKGGYSGKDGTYLAAPSQDSVSIDTQSATIGDLVNQGLNNAQLKLNQATSALAKLRALRAKLAANQANAAKAVGGAGKGSGNKGSGGGGGGGSSKKDEEAEQIDLLEDESDIYHDINIQIQQLEDELKDLQRVEETFTGKDLIDNLNKQLEVMEKQRDTLAEKIEIAKQEADIYRTALEDYGATFDANGEITNYFSLLQDQLEKTNDVIERYNNLSAEQQTDEEKKKVEDAQQQYDDLLSIIEAYEKVINDTIPKLEDEIQEKLLDEIELQIQKFNMEVELRLDMREAAEDWNEFKRKVIDDLDDDSLTGKAQEAFDNILSYYDTAGSGEGVIGSEMQHIQDILGELAKMDAGSHSDVYSAYDDTLGVWIDDRATAMEDLKNAYDELSEALEEVKDLEDEVHEAFLDSIDATKDAYDSQADQFEFVQDQLEHDIDLIEQLYGDDAYDRMAEFYDKQAQLAQQSVASRQQEVNYWKRLMDAEQEAVLNGAGDKEALAAYTENWQDALDQLNESIETWAEAMTETYKNTISGVIQELNNQITNGLGLDYVGEEFELMKDNMDDYLDAINSAYALDDLRNKWQDAINGTDDLAIQQQLSDMMQHQLDMLERKGELTQYDIDRAEKEYEIALKQIALQEAQQNKTKMRLRRDANGNYSYQFVSDEDEMRQAQQELAATQNELYNFDKGAYQDNLNEMYSTWNEFQEKIADAYVTYADDQDALNEHIAMLQEQYQEKINRLTEQNLNIRNNLYSSAFDEMADLYNVDISNFENMTQQEKDLIMSDLIPTWEAGVQQMIDTFAGDGGFGPAVEEIFDQLDQAAQNYVDRMLEISDVNQQISEEAFDEMDQILDFSDQLIEAAQSEYEAIQDVLEQVRELAQAYAQAKEEAVSATTAAYSYWQQEQAKAAEASAKENANISAASTPTSGTASGSGSDTTPAAGNSTTAGSGAETPSSEAAQEPAAAAPQKIRVPKSGVHAAVAIQFWEGGNGNWGTGGTRRSRCNELGIDYNYAQHTFADKLNGGTKSKMLSKVKSLGANMSGINLNDFRYDNYKKNRDKYEMYKTGGYTGEWVGRDGKFAMLHQKELVLNEEDTSNILLAVEAMRNVTKTIDANMLNSMTSLLTGFGAYGGGFGSPSQTLDQNVHIDAHFPNVQNSREIEDAFNNLVNIASQRAFRNKRGS